MKTDITSSFRALGAVGVTVPACFYILKASPEEAHHLHVPHSPHGDEKHTTTVEHDDEKTEAAQDKKSIKADKGEESSDHKEEKSDDKEKSEPKPEDKENRDVEKSDQSNEGAKPAENDDQGNNTIKKIEGDKGATKLRKDSTNAIKAGTDDKVVHSDDPRAPKDTVCADYPKPP